MLQQISACGSLTESTMAAFNRCSGSRQGLVIRRCPLEHKGVPRSRPCAGTRAGWTPAAHLPDGRAWVAVHRATFFLRRSMAAEPGDGDQQVERPAQLVQPPRVPADERLPLLVGELGRGERDARVVAEAGAEGQILLEAVEGTLTS